MWVVRLAAWVWLWEALALHSCFLDAPVHAQPCPVPQFLHLVTRALLWLPRHCRYLGNQPSISPTLGLQQLPCPALLQRALACQAVLGAASVLHQEERCGQVLPVALTSSEYQPHEQGRLALPGQPLQCNMGAAWGWAKVGLRSGELQARHGVQGTSWR